MKSEIRDMNDKNYSVPIIIFSLAIPLVVAILYLMPKPSVEAGFDITVLPAFHAILNSLTTFLLLTGYYFIRNHNRKLHKICMINSLVLSVIFLLSYVTYHSLSEPTQYGGEGIARAVYYFFLLTHIVLAAAIVPLVLITLVRALSDRFDKHRRIARWTLPLWLYVTVTGVIVYFMIAPYY